MDAAIDAMRLAEQFADRVLDLARLPGARRNELRNACMIEAEPQRLVLACGITGSTY